jgi:hypothetical protein
MKVKFFRPLFLFFTFFCFFIGQKNQVFADNMESDSYKIQFGNFNMASGKRSGDTYILSDTMGGLAVGPYGQYGSSSYFIGSGFQYVYQIDYFSFSISKLSIELGELFANSFKTDSHTISITTSSAGGYGVYAFENHPLRMLTSSDIIIDTSCDLNDCDETTAASWTDPSKAGFGFNASGDDVSSDFVNTNYFRQFANNEASEAMQLIMGSSDVALDRTATISYKASMPGEQAAGNYQTSIVFVAVPGY